MTSIDNKFQFPDKTAKTIHTKVVKNYLQSALPKEEFSEIEDIVFLKMKAHIVKVYNKICDKMDLDEQIRPVLDFETTSMNAAGFNNKTAKIFFNEELVKDLDDKDTFFILRHELEHVKQMQNIMRMLGLEKFVNLINPPEENSLQKELQNFNKVNTDYYKKVEQVLGKIDENSPEGILTQKYIDAYKKYPDLNKLLHRTDICKVKKFLLFVKEYILHYKFNFLEKDANKAAKKFLSGLKL